MRTRLGLIAGLSLVLLSQGLWAQSQAKGGEPPNLEEAVLRLDANSVRAFLDKGATPDTPTSFVGANRQGTILMYAANAGSMEIVTLLVRAGARLDSIDGYGMTALSFAMLRKDGEAMAAYLIEAGAKIAVPVFDSERRKSWPFALAVYRGWMDLVDLGLGKSDPEVFRQLDEGLKQLGAEGKVEALEALIKHGVRPVWNLDASDALVTAAAAGRIDVIVTLLESGVPVDAADSTALTPLAAAVEAGKTEAVKYLLEKGAHPNARDSGGQSVLDKARAFDTNFLVDVLLAAGAKGDLFDAIRLGDLAAVKSLATPAAVNQRKVDDYIPDNGYTPLMAAVQGSRLEIIQILVERGARIEEERRFNPDSGAEHSAGALDLAVMDGKAEILRYLLSKGGKASGDLLLLAAMNGQLDCAKALVEKGADVKTTRAGQVWSADEEGSSWVGDVLSAAIESSRGNPAAKALVDYLRKKGARLSFYALAAAIGAENLDLVRECLAQGIEPDADCLVYACGMGNLEIAKALLAKGANPDGQSVRGWTALTTAASRGNYPLVRTLVEAGATVGLPNRNGERALDLANDSREEGRYEIVNFLNAVGPEPGAYKGRMALTSALLKGDTKGMERLLMAGANPDSRFYIAGEGEMSAYPPSLLDVAAVLGNRATVEVLVRAGASVASIDKGLDYVARAGRKDLVRLLLSVKDSKEEDLQRSFLRVLYIGAETGDAGLVSLVFELGRKADASALDDLLVNAVVGGFPEVVKIFLDQGANPNKVGPYYPQYGRSLLALAMKRGKSETIRLLLSRGARDDNLLDSGMTPLTALIRSGQDRLAGALLANGAKVGTRERGGDTVLHAAATMRDLTVAEELIRMGGGGLDSPGEGGDSPLVRAITLPEGQAFAALLIRHGAKVREPGMKGFTAIDAALAAGAWNEEVAGMLARAYNLSPSPDPSLDERERLFLAFMKGDLATARNLLATGRSPVDFPAWRGRTALMGLASRGNIEAVRLLLDKGAAPAGEDEGGWSAYALASWRGQVETVGLLRPPLPSSSSAGQSLLRQAVLAGDLDFLASLLAAGVNAEALDARGDSALWLAAREGRTEALRLLLAAKVPAATRRAYFSAQGGNWSLGPVDIAGLRGNWKAFDLLLDAGAKPNWLGILSLPPTLSPSTASPGMELALRFVAKADPAYKGDNQRIVTSFLAARGESEAVKYLLANSASPVDDLSYMLAAGGLPSDLDYRGIAAALEKRGRSVWKAEAESELLPLVIRLGETDILRALLELGADPNAQDREGSSLLRLAARDGRPALVELLIARGAKDPLSPPQLVGLIEWK